MVHEPRGALLTLRRSVKSVSRPTNRGLTSGGRSGDILSFKTDLSHLGCQIPSALGAEGVSEDTEELILRDRRKKKFRNRFLREEVVRSWSLSSIPHHGYSLKSEASRASTVTSEGGCLL